MTAYRYDPYLWVHLAGLATVPFWLTLCLLGLAVDYSTQPALELSLVLGFGLLPVLYMQLRRPFCIFGLLLLALKPSALTEEQRQLLTVFRYWRIRLIAPLVSLVLGWFVVQLYQMAPIASAITPFDKWGRLGGLVIATIGVFGANLFLQVPMSVLGVLATSNSSLQAAAPYPVTAINQDFCHFGIPAAKILPPITLPVQNLQPTSPLRKTSSTGSVGVKSAQPSHNLQQENDGPSPLEEQSSGVQGV
jgi:hypothetical protein